MSFSASVQKIVFKAKTGIAPYAFFRKSFSGFFNNFQHAVKVFVLKRFAAEDCKTVNKILIQRRHNFFHCICSKFFAEIKFLCLFVKAVFAVSSAAADKERHPYADAVCYIIFFNCRNVHNKNPFQNTGRTFLCTSENVCIFNFDKNYAAISGLKITFLDYRCKTLSFISCVLP